MRVVRDVFVLREEIREMEMYLGARTIERHDFSFASPEGKCEIYFGLAKWCPIITPICATFLSIIPKKVTSWLPVPSQSKRCSESLNSQGKKSPSYVCNVARSLPSHQPDILCESGPAQGIILGRKYQKGNSPLLGVMKEYSVLFLTHTKLTL